MKALLCLLLLPLWINAQQTTTRQLVALTIVEQPDPTAEGKYYLIVDKPDIVKVNPNQTFLLQSAWHKEGDSIVSIGAGIVVLINDKTLELRSTVYPGKIVQEGDMALFLVPLEKPTEDTLFYKFARLGIIFSSIEDTVFYDRSRLLENAAAYPTKLMLTTMMNDIKHTADALIKIKSKINQEIKSGPYKGQMLFTVMQKVTADAVLQFILYVYMHPDKYKAHQWRVSETFATWATNGAP